MAFDGFTTAALADELSDRLTGARVFRVIMPENDELLLTLKPMMEKGGGQVRLCLSADPSLPLCYLTDTNKQAPASAPAFCMLLRKYLQNGKIVSVTQPGLERSIRLEIEHMNEMGDLCRHVLVIELMGKHSNIILLDDKEHTHIVDSIKHVSAMVSSVREVLPGREYFIPETQGKRNPLSETKENFMAALQEEHVPAAAFLVRSFTGFSNVIAEETVFRTRLGQDRSVSEFTRDEQELFYNTFEAMLEYVRNGNFSPTVYYHLGAADTLSQGEPVEYSAVPLTMYRDLPSRTYDSISSLIENYYQEKNAVTRIRQKSQDLRRIVQTILERDVHKYDLQSRQLKDTQKREKYRLYGELLNTYGYNIPEGAESAQLENYYTGETVKVPLDPARTPQQNAQHYFDRYMKQKRTAEALTQLTEQVKAEISQLRSIRTSLDLSTTEGDLAQIRRELEESGFIHAKPQKGSGRGSSKVQKGRPLHYVSSDGYDLYVGKNNTQNDELTFHFAKPTDIWFHANDVPGSHVILCTGGKPFEQIPDRAFEEAAALAAYYSQGREAGRVEIDYLERKGVKKPSGARPGFVIYHSNYSLTAKADIKGLRLIE
ncbi:MAG: NFACT RNA binding domain-containing protein [Lachnospiraceae bacterium]|nr:NFACT RNA binding domain-containing protein [Lachnospiraceae bacterium]